MSESSGEVLSQERKCLRDRRPGLRRRPQWRWCCRKRTDVVGFASAFSDVIYFWEIYGEHSADERCCRVEWRRGKRSCLLVCLDVG